MDNIPANRKSSVRLKIKDSNGKELSGVKVDYKLNNHEFLFGCNAFEVGMYMLVPEGEKKEFLKDRVDKWLDLFNFATVPFYWGGFEKEEGKPQTESIMTGVKFLKEKGVKIKGHPLCWHTVCADWLLKYDNQAIMEKQLKRIEREVSNFKGLVDMWDVINEVVIMPVFDKYDNAVTRICKEYGQVELVKKVFDEARKYNPNATLLLNDFNTSPKYEDLIERCLDAGVEISAIGIQSHQHQGYWGKEKTLDVVERFSRFGLPLHFTENTLVSGTPIPAYIEDLNDWQVKDWPSTPDYEELQKNNMIEMYRTLFSCPSVQAITNWDFADGAWLNAPSGVIRKDSSVKPAYTALKDLIHKEWTTEGSIVTDSDGFAKVEGFKGEYIISYMDKTAKFTISDDIAEAEIIL